MKKGTKKIKPVKVSKKKPVETTTTEAEKHVIEKVETPVIENASENLEAAIDAVDSQPEAPKVEIDSGAFDEQESTVPIEEPVKDINDSLSVTFLIDSLFGFIGIIFFDDASDLQLTAKELKYYEALEKRCGVELFINSPYFYFAMLTMAYASKVVMLIKAKKAMKELEKQAA